MIRRHACTNPHHQGEEVTLHLRLPAEDISTLLDDLRREAADGNVGAVGVPVRRLTHVTVGGAPAAAWWRRAALLLIAVGGAWIVSEMPQPSRWIALAIFLVIVLTGRERTR